MRNYEIRAVPKVDADGDTYWTAWFPAIEGCVGGGTTCDEAIKDAEENLDIFLEYLQDEGKIVPSEYKENRFSGKIALRVSPFIHQKIALCAEKEDISINMFINNAISYFIGMTDTDMYRNELDEIRDNTADILKNQLLGNALTKQIWNTTHLPFEKMMEGIKVGE